MPNVLDSSQILSPTGVALNPQEFANNANMTNVAHAYVVQPIPGTVVRAQRAGNFKDFFHPGAKGTITVEILAGAAGSAQEVLSLQNAPGGAFDARVHIFLDATNRPSCQITTSAGPAATYTAGGSAVAEGTPMQLKLTWDATAGTASFVYFNGQSAGGSFGAITPWVPAPMVFMASGYDPATTNDPFAGTIRMLQVADQ